MLALRGTVVFPGASVRLRVGRRRSLAALEAAAAGDGRVVLVAQRRAETEAPSLDDLHPVGVIAAVRPGPELEGGKVRLIIADGLARCRLCAPAREEPFLAARVESLAGASAEVSSSLAGEVRTLFLSGPHREERTALLSVFPEAADVGFLIASQLDLSPDDAQALLSEPDAGNRYRMLLPVLRAEEQIARVGRDLWKQAVARAAGGRERHLRERKAAIERELGELSGRGADLQELRERVAAAGLSEEARAEAERELARMERTAPGQPEYGVAEDYLEWLTSLPWRRTETAEPDLRRARRILDRDHHDRDEVKERVLEYLSVRRLRRGRQGALLCLVGPPGVGKTSMGRSIAEATGRRFYRVALGGLRDEAEVRGHRRTYLGAHPGAILRAMRRVGVSNPVIMLDEVDKLGEGPMGDPAGALLEVLDPEQNAAFVDRYLAVGFDLSDVLFIGTANTALTIPGPLLDRLEVIELPGYTTEEKAVIARGYLVPRQVEETGLDPAGVAFDDEAVELLITHYTREAGVRELERQIAAVCRKLVRRGEGRASCPARVRRRLVADLLGPPPYLAEDWDRACRPGVCATLAVGDGGAELMFIEVLRVDGSGRLAVTGRVGAVLRESASLALGYWKARGERFGLAGDRFAQGDFHVHLPGGSAPKDGPAAGLPLALAFASRLFDRSLPPGLAALGEITLHGRVLPVGRIGERLAGARRAGISHVLLPERNRVEVESCRDRRPPEGLEITYVSSVEEALETALAVVPQGRPAPA